MGHKPLGVCSDTLHLNAQPRNLILPKAQGTSVVMGRAAALWTYHITTTGPPVLTAPGGLLMIMVALRICPGVGVAEINFD